MKTLRNKILIGVAITLFTLMGMVSNSTAAGIALPNPTQTYDGIYVAWAHDDFWSYSAKFLQLVVDGGYIPASYGNYQFATGSGGLDVILFTGAAGQTNPYGLVGPVYNAGGNGANHFAGVWGAGTTKVSDVLYALNQINPGSTIPAFYLDLNQTGNNLDLWFSGQVYLVDPDSKAVVHTWAFDTLPQGSGSVGDNDWPGFGLDGTYDPDYPGIALGLYPQTGTSGTLYDPNHSKGSGRPDYIAFAPSMDLSNYNPNLLFYVDFRMGTPEGGWGALNNGYEEIFLTALKTTQVPEPATMLLLGLGLVGLAGAGRKFKS
jgi:hypothetical protein